MKITVCLTTWNSAGTIELCLKVLDVELVLLEENGVELEVAIFDQCSTDGTVHLLKSLSEKLVCICPIIFTDKNIGQSKFRNIPAKAHECDYLIFIDGDVTPIPRVLTTCWSGSKGHPICRVFYRDIRGDTGKVTSSENPPIALAPPDENSATQDEMNKRVTNIRHAHQFLEGAALSAK